LAFLGVAIWAVSAVRGLHAVAWSMRYGAECCRMSREARLGEDGSPVWVLEGQPGVLALAGILRPRIFVSRQLVEELTAEQMAAAVRHERAHSISRDNLKRLLMVFTPGLLPFWRGFDVLERRWSRFTEWAADDRAVDGDSMRSLSLAAALVRVARMRPARQASALVTSLLEGTADLSMRVERLLDGAPRAGWPVWPVATLAALGMVLAAGALAAAGQPATFQAVHGLLERLIG
jgi:Zn-dependent protease with chaperone function